MTRKFSILLSLLALHDTAFMQTYPVYGPEKSVTIAGLTFDAMEPFISPDGNTLFFNSLNSGGNTNLYYATRNSDTNFTFIGLMNGTYDPSTDHLDAVASLDSANTFFWISLRGYPSALENVHKGTFSGGTVSSVSRVYGDFYINNFTAPFGWLIMDAAVSYQGDLLYYCNAQFDFSSTSCVGIPCKARLGVAKKSNDSTFARLSDSEVIFGNVNDTSNYLVYAPQVSKDGLELYYTRLKKSTFNTEICVAVRNSTAAAFSVPVVIHSKTGYAPEGASPSLDQQKIYYHQKDVSGKYSIFLRYRSTSTALNKTETYHAFRIYPNPSPGFFEIGLPYPDESFQLIVYSVVGQELCSTGHSTSIDLSGLADGFYLVKVMQLGRTWITRIAKAG